MIVDFIAFRGLQLFQTFQKHEKNGEALADPTTIRALDWVEEVQPARRSIFFALAS